MRHTPAGIRSTPARQTICSGHAVSHQKHSATATDTAAAPAPTAEITCRRNVPEWKAVLSDLKVVVVVVSVVVVVLVVVEVVVTVTVAVVVAVEMVVAAMVVTVEMAVAVAVSVVQAVTVVVAVAVAMAMAMAVAAVVALVTTATIVYRWWRVTRHTPSDVSYFDVLVTAVSVVSMPNILLESRLVKHGFRTHVCVTYVFVCLYDLSGCVADGHDVEDKSSSSCFFMC